MFTILIADDEKEERDGISFLLDEFNYPFQKAFAENGKAALSYLTAHPVDILFTDVRMPVMDGLALAKEARKRFPQLKIIIYSGFSEFEYARTAITIGVASYILKPVNIDEFRSTLDSVADELRNENKERDQRKRNEAYARKHLLFSLLNYKDGGDAFLPEGSLPPGSYKRMLLLEFENNFFDVEGTSLEQEILSMLPITADYLNLDMCQSILLFSSCRETSYYTDIAKMLFTWIREHKKRECYLALSAEICGSDSLSHIFRTLEEMMEYRFFAPDIHIYDGNTPDDSFSREDTRADILLERIHEALEAKDYVCLTENINLLCRKYEGSSAFSQLYVKFVFSSLYRDLNRALNPQAMPEQELNDAIDRLYRSSDIREITEKIRLLAATLQESLPPEESGVSREVDIVKDYIDTHFGEDLDLSSLAEKVYLSPRYLSTLFKRVTGLGINRYIKTVRMEKAKELLQDTNIKIVELCETVGFRNLSYFCQNFRDYYGETPEKYRNTDFYHNRSKGQ